MIHQYKLGGYNIVLDVCSGAVHAVDEIAYDIIAMFETESREAILAAMEESGDVAWLPQENPLDPEEESPRARYESIKEKID